MAGNVSLTREYNRIFSIMRDELSSNVIFDNVSTRTALLFWYKLNDAIVRLGGRPHLRFNILKELPSAVGYSDLDTLTPVRADPVTSAVFEWKQLAAPVQVSGLDMIKTGDDGIEDLLELFIQAAETALKEALGGSSIGLFSSADETNVRAITGLQNIFGTSTTTGTVGNISRATLTAWRHQLSNVSSDFSANGLSSMRELYRNTGRFDENVDTIVLTGAAMDNFEATVTNSFQINLPLLGVGPGNQMMIDAGFAKQAPSAIWPEWSLN